MGLSWNKQLSIANTIVDSEHKHLISLTNQVERAMKTAMELRNDTPLQQAFEQLENELQHHFRNEEKIAHAINFPFDQHLQAQHHMLMELRYLRAELLTKDCIWTDAALQHFAQFLQEWMIEHITQADMPMKSTLQGYDYNFWPDWDDKSLAQPHIQRAQEPSRSPLACAAS
ncbi:MAG TPA: hemerythrin family protein [Gallionella sp.]|nr:hemerythrin family protein [Gallionella sp.]